MAELAKDGAYTIEEAMRQALEDFYGGYASMQETGERIRLCMRKQAMFWIRIPRWLL